MASIANQKPQDLSWLSLPNKPQLAVIVLARLAEPLSERALTSYIFFQLRSFGPALSDATIANQVAALTAAFAAAQCVTGMLWGRAADHPRLGRKAVLLVGLLGSCIAALGVGLSTSFGSVMFFRLLAGGLNGNVGVLRTMISEIVPEQQHRSRAFLLLPMTFNLGVIIGPLLGGFLAEPVTSFPSLFGPGSALGGPHGVRWMVDYPYLLPNLVCAIFFLFSWMSIILLLQETHPLLQERRDRGLEIGRYLLKMVYGGRSTYDYRPVPDSLEPDDEEDIQAARSEEDGETESHQPKPEPPEGLSALCTRNVALSLLQNWVSTLHVSAFNVMLFVLLPAARVDRGHGEHHSVLAGGLGLSPQQVGFASTVIGIVGFPLQILLFPWASARLGILQCYRLFLPFGALAYVGLPWLTLLAHQATALWPGVIVVLSLQVLSRTFVGPASVMVVNEASPHPTLLGTMHGIASSTSAAARVLGPLAGASLLGWGLHNELVGIPFWLLTLIAGTNWVVLWFIKDI